MENSPAGQYLPVLQPGRAWTDVASAVQACCPFSGGSAGEDELGEALFGAQPGIQRSPLLGWHLGTAAMRCTRREDRLGSSAGGVGTWLARKLLESGTVDGVACVGEGGAGGAAFSYQMIRDPAELERCRKSKYYPVELSAIWAELAQAEGRFAVTALPCFAKALRTAAARGLLRREKIHCIIGLFCGHLKTRQFAQYLAQCCGLGAERAQHIDFRRKDPARRACDYSFAAAAADGSAERSIPMAKTMLGNWGLNAFMLKACECCDDVVAELADVSIGDAWMEPFIHDGLGTNLVITRRADLAELLQRGVDAGELAEWPLRPQQIAAAQDGAFRQRRQGLAYRLHLARRRGEWRPKRRVAPDARALGLAGRLTQLLRLRIARRTKDVFRQFEHRASATAFERRMLILVWLHRTLRAARRCAALRRSFLFK